MKRFALTSWLLLLACTVANAGSLSKGTWTPSSCGSKPDAPVIDGSSVDTYNSSIAAIREWQQTSKVYFDCLVKEANADNNTIADTATKEQAKYREEIDRLSQEAESVSKQLNGQ